MPKIEEIPGIRELWEQTVGNPAITIGLIEGRPELSHPCFDGAHLTVLEPHWLPELPVEPVTVEHATFVASLLFGQHDSTVRGLVPRCQGVLVPALRDEPTVLDPINAVRAIETLLEADVDIIHFAASHPTSSDDTDILVKRAIAQAIDAGVLVVAPAGNDYGRNRVIPAILPGVLAVGALNDDGAMYRFSNWGPQYRAHGIVAPGGNVAAAAPGGTVAIHKGTSVSAPIVTGTVALLSSLRHERGLPSDPLAVRDALIASARPCTPEQSHGEPERCLAGRLDLPRATELALADSAVVTSTEIPVQQLVYASGTLGYDFPAQARRDVFQQLLTAASTTVSAAPSDSNRMVGHLTEHPAEASELIWTLDIEFTPHYAIEPTGPYAAEIYQLLTRLRADATLPPDHPEHVERIAIPGRLTGRTARLCTGQDLPIVEVQQTRGIRGWKSIGDATKATSSGQHDDEAVTTLREFRARISYDLRNLGASSRDRALNFAATTAFQETRTFATVLRQGMVLDSVTVDQSPFARRHSDCWNVKLRFFDPENTDRVNRVYCFTIDVSDIVPIAVGNPKEWPERS
jgi:hypothetical protein